MPSAALENQLSDVDTFHVLVSAFTDQVLVFLLHCALINDVVEGPGWLNLATADGLAGLVHSGDFLLHGSEEALRVEEPTKPEGVGSVALHPLIELLVSFDQVVEPLGQGWDDPGDLGSSCVVHPLVGHSCVEDSVDGVHDFSCHDDLTVDSIACVNEGLSDDVEDHLHSSDFLGKEDVERDCITNCSQSLRSTEFLDQLSDLVFTVIQRHLGEEVNSLLFDDLLSGLSSTR